MTKTLYQVLGLDPSAEDVVVRAAFKVLAQKYHPDKLKGGTAQSGTLMVDINLSYRILSNPISRKKYDQALKESLGNTAKPAHTSSNQHQRPQYHPTAKRHTPSQRASSYASNSEDESGEHEYDKLIQRIKANAMDEIELVNLFEKLFKIPLSIRQGYSNTYQFEENGKKYTHDFSSLKEVVVQKLKFEMGQVS
jgi:DnaJ-class molecular chaperone